MTQPFPFAWIGGNSASRQLKDLCESKGNDLLRRYRKLVKRDKAKKKTENAVGQICPSIKADQEYLFGFYLLCPYLRLLR
jgi:hypothetical protein